MTRRLAILVLLLARPVHAEPARDVTADEAVALYREHSARLAASRAAIDVTAADVVQARLYPNPEAGLSTARTVHGDTAGPGWQYGMDLSVPVLVGRQRGHRERAAHARVDAIRTGVALDQATAELGVRGAFAALQAAQQRSATLAAAVEDVRTVRVIVAGRSMAGASSPYALERIDLAIAALASRLDEAHADELSASASLATAVGIPGWLPHALGALEDPAPPPRGLDPAHPALAAERSAFVLAHAEQALAHAEGIPTPSLELEAFTTRDPVGVALTAGFSVPLPLFDRNQGGVARSRAAAHRAALELAARTAELSSELDRAARVSIARREALARFRTETLERLPRIRAMAESAYRSGQGGIVELLDALDAITEAKLRELELTAAVSDAALAIRAASAGR